MRYYIIHNNQVLIAENINTLYKYYDEEIKELPEDYSAGKYIIVDNELVLNPDWEEEQKEYERENEIKNIKAELDALDLKSIRAIRSNDTEYIQKYEEEAQELRDKLKELN